MILKTGAPESVGMSSEKIEYVKKLVPGWIQQKVTPAFAGFVARKGVVVFHEAYGDLTPQEESLPILKDTIFPLCSISKIFTTTAAMLLVEDGLLSINRPVAWYIPEFGNNGKDQIMIHHLMTHTSGLEDSKVWEHVEIKMEDLKRGLIKIPEAPADQDSDIHEELYLSFDVSLSRKPGEFMSYCNFNMLLLGEVIRRVSGRSLDAFFRERIFHPLGMNDTFLVVPQSVWDRVVSFPEDSEHGRWLCTERHFNSQSAAGGAYSTVKDMGIFGQMILNKGIYNGKRILSPITVQKMIYDRIPGIQAGYGEEHFKNASWGLGWNVFGNKLDVESCGLQSEKAFGHGGAGRSMFWIDPVYDVVGFLFYVKMPPEFRRPDDLFRNAMMSSIFDEML